MRLIIIFFIAILVIAVLANLGQLIKGGFERISSQGQEQSLENQVSLESAGLATVHNPISKIDTYITAGPEEGEAIEANIATFEFGAKSLSGDNLSWVSFETKIEGLDKDWQRSSSPKRTVSFPPGSTEYTFLVRAKTNDSTDLTPAKRTFKVNLSPYFQKVRISNVRTPYSSYHSVITLKAHLNKEEEINITGWKIKGRRGEFNLPQGIKRYFPGFPAKDIIIEKDSTIYLSGGESPLRRDKSFRLNKCLGYLAKSDNSSLSIPKSCPRPSEEEISHLKPCCQEFIRRIRGCEVPDYSNDPRIYEDSGCVSYLKENFNYEGCFMNYSRDDDFLKNSWYIYPGSDIATSDYCDTIYLWDQDGLLVDSYDYGRDVCR